jgi:anti-sigma regulatory factor (Ser/Thr protein kinase)
MPGGFTLYMQERERRLAALNQGCISIELEQRKGHDRCILKIRVKDSGPGFDHQAILRSLNSVEIRIIGCGIPLVKSLCSQMKYLGAGNEVVVHYLL